MGPGAQIKIGGGLGGPQPILGNQNNSNVKKSVFDQDEDDNPIMGPGSQVKIGGGLGGGLTKSPAQAQLGGLSRNPAQNQLSSGLKSRDSNDDNPITGPG